MPPAPEFTVIIPTRNRWPLLRTTLRSALDQEGVELEVVVVDDGSTDETAAGLASVGDERVRVVRHPASRGVAAARNAGIASARGEWLAFLDDDDLWAPDKLRTQRDAAVAQGGGWAYGSALVVDDRRSVIDRIDAPAADRLLETLLEYNPMPAGSSNVLARTAVVREVGGHDETFFHFAGWDLWIRLAVAAPAVACPEPLVAYVQHPGSMLITERERVVAEWKRVAAKHGALAAQHGVEFDRWGLVGWLAWADSRVGRRYRAATGYARAGVMYAFHRNLWMTRVSLRAAARALLGRPLTDTGHRPGRPAVAAAPAWLADGRSDAP